MKRALSIAFLCFLALTVLAQQAQLRKLSPMLRSLSAPTEMAGATMTAMIHCASVQEKEVCAFVRITSEGDEVLRSYNCRPLAKAGNIYIASIPIRSLRPMTLDNRVNRIEARPMATTQLDSVRRQTGVSTVHQGIGT